MGPDFYRQIIPESLGTVLNYFYAMATVVDLHYVMIQWNYSR